MDEVNVEYDRTVQVDDDDDVVQSDFSTGYNIVRRNGINSENNEDSSVNTSKSYVQLGKQNISLPSDQTLSYKDALEFDELEREKETLLKELAANQEGLMAPPPIKLRNQVPNLVSESEESDTGERRRKSRWDQKNAQAEGQSTETTKRSRWDQTPAMVAPAQTPSFTTLGSQVLTRLSRRDENLRVWTDEELDLMLPSDGYEIVKPPAGYSDSAKIKTSLLAPPTPASGMTGTSFSIPSAAPVQSYGIPLSQHVTSNVAAKPPSDLPIVKPEDMHYFGKLLEPAQEVLSKEEETSRLILTLLLKIKNGVPSVRKQALRQITDDAPKLGAEALFNHILPLLINPSLDEQERHLLVKVVDRVLFRLEDTVRPFADKILAVISPMLIEEDYYAQVEGREIISNLSKACGLATMIKAMSRDIDNADDFVRNTTSKALSVVASALGIQSICPFIRAVCRSKKSWEARHTGIKVVQQIAVLVGCAVLPHLNSLIECIAPGLKDDQPKIRTMTALSLASLAEASHPYGFESFDPVLRDLWDGIARYRGKGLAAFLKCLGCIIPLMDDEDAVQSVQRVTPVLVREFESPDEDIKKIILKAVKQCSSVSLISPSYLRDNILPRFFTSFWVRRNALDKKNNEAVVETTVALARKVGAAIILEKLVDNFKDENEHFRRMTTDCTERILKELGADDVSSRLEERLVDGILYAFQEQNLDDMGNIMLKGFIRILQSFGKKSKQYLAQISAAARWRLQNKSPPVRMQAADLIGGLAPIIKYCGEEELLGHLGVILYENLGEEFPDVLGSILGALKAIVVNLGVDDMNPPIRDLLPRLTPILRNSNEKVAENLIELVGRIADTGAGQVTAREWMRICFELLEMLRSPKMSIRRAAVNTFGFIARAVGPQDVLHTLLTNLRVQERQMRVCTTVAIAIVAESCAPFTILPGLMNEYRTPDINVQNGVLKALSFMLQYIGPMAVDYVYALTPLLQSALSDRDHVHRQTACDAVKHLALGVAGRGCEDCLTHLLNFVFPNIFEQSPHVARAVLEAIEALRVPLGAGKILLYLLPGLFHPARSVRQVYWRLYNNLYVGDADGLVPCYPRFDQIPSLASFLETQGDDHDSKLLETFSDRELSREGYRRTYLELFI